MRRTGISGRPAGGGRGSANREGVVMDEYVSEDDTFAVEVSEVHADSWARTYGDDTYEPDRTVMRVPNPNDPDE